MRLTQEEKARKELARKLLGYPVKDRPSQVYYCPSTTLKPALYRVVLARRVVCFQYVNGRYYYQGEQHLESHPDLAAHYEAKDAAVEAAEVTLICDGCGMDGPDIQKTILGLLCLMCREERCLAVIDHSEPAPDLDTCTACMTLMLANNGKVTNEGFRCFGCLGNLERHEKAYELLKGDPAADIDTCTRCKTVMLASKGEMTNEGFRCSECLEIARKFEHLGQAIRIVMVATKEAYPLTDKASYRVSFSSSGFITITRNLREEHGRETPVSGFRDIEGLASDLLHRIKANEERAAIEVNPIKWVKGKAYKDLGIETIAREMGLDEIYNHLKPVEDFNADAMTVDCIPCTIDGEVCPLWKAQYHLCIDPITVMVSAIIES